jgi:glutathione S-transferase
MADILLFVMVDFMGTVGQPIPADCKNLTAWYGRMKARPSAAA